jgi:DNA-binding SARP family transcriptional activator
VLAGGALAGDAEITSTRPRERPIAVLFSALLVAGALFLAVPTLRAEWTEWNAARDGTLDAGDLAAIEHAAKLDAFNVERQYAVATKLLQAARLDPSEADPRLAAARERLHRALELVPNHVASLDALAEVEARSGDEKAASAALDRLHALEPWRGPASVRLAELLAGGGHELAAARSRLESEGDAAVAPLFQQAKALRAASRNRPAAQVLDLIAPRAPEDGDLWRELALALHDLGDEPGYRRAYRQSQVAYALAALADNRSEDARGNLDVARKYAPEPGAALEELLEACVDLQRGRLDDARARLAALEPEAALSAAQTASPTAARFLGMLARNPALQSEAERLGLDRLGRRGN